MTITMDPSSGAKKKETELKSTDTGKKKNSAKAEKSKQSARDCRVRKKLRYQYLEEMVICREKAVMELRNELSQLKKWCLELDSGIISNEAETYFTAQKQKLLDSAESSVTPAIKAEGPLQTAESSVTASTICDTSTLVNTDEQQCRETNAMLQTVNLGNSILGFNDQQYAFVSASALDNVLHDSIVSSSAASNNDLDIISLLQSDNQWLSEDTSTAVNFISDFEHYFDNPNT